MSIILAESLVKRYGVQYKAGDIIFCEFEKGDACYFLQNGTVQIVKLIGKQRILDIIEPGNFFGEMSIFENLPRSATAIAKDLVLALRFNKNDFSNLIQNYPELPYQLLAILSHRIQDANRRLQSLALTDPTLRILDTLLRLIERSSDLESQGKDFFLKLSFEDISKWCGLSTSEVEKIIRALSLKNIIHYASERVYIKDIDQLKKLIIEREK